ncbi:hypothetical protein KPH14_010405 [Odynerus spinipes]|nr:hypothetical protein KPH14_010405 [Odynerus spinipes]
MSNGEYMKSDGGNESTANNKIQVDSSERVWPNVMEPLAESTPDRHTNKSNISPCCMSPLPSEKMHVPTIVSEMPNQKHGPTKVSEIQNQKHAPTKISEIPNQKHAPTKVSEIPNQKHGPTKVSEIPNQKHGPTKVSKIPNQKHVSEIQNQKHDVFEPSNKNSDNFNAASYRCASTQCMKINGQSPAISDSSDYQFVNELQVSRKLLPCCTVSNDTNSSIEKLEKFIDNTSVKTTNENTINDTVEDIYIRNTKKRLRDNYKNDNVIHPARHRESVPSTVNMDADIKYVANFKETFSEFDAFTTKNLIPCDCNDREKVASDYTIDEIPQTMKQNDEQNEEECSCENKSYSHLTDTVTKAVIRNTEINELHKTNASDVTNVAQPDDNKTTNDVKGPTQTNQCKTIVIICPKFKFKKIISDIKEHTKSLEQQIANINNIVKSIIILSDQKTSSVLEKENLTIFYEKSNENSNEPQTEKFVDRNNNNVEQQVKHESTRGTNVDKHIKERALSTSSLTQKSPIHQEPVTTLIKENLIKNDEQISPHVKVKEEVPTIEMNTTKYESDQINVKGTPHEHHETKHISYSDKTYTSAIEAPEIEPTFVDSLTKDICDFTSCDTGYIHYSTLSDRDSISDLNLQTTFTQSSNCQIVAATSVSSNELNFNAKPTNCLVLRDNRRKSNNKDDVFPASMNVSTTIDDLKPSISIQCVTISNSSNCCIADLQALEITNSSPRDNLDKLFYNTDPAFVAVAGPAE